MHSVDGIDIALCLEFEIKHCVIGVSFSYCWLNLEE